MAGRYLVAIVGGAVSGAEAAAQLTSRGIRCVVFDQNLLPYGKIEDGLPKWHSKLRDKEENNIDQKLSHELIHFVPGIRLGRDIQLDELVNQWGFSAVLLAIGAWRDRPLPVDGIDAYQQRGLIYQNSFIHWFNHKHEPGFSGDAYEIRDGAVVIGGGLASLDVVKVLMIETVQEALTKRGHNVSLFDLDRSIARVLDDLDLSLEDIGVSGCTLYYRRRIKDMPLTPFTPVTPEEVLKAESVREKILNNYRKKYLFRVEPQCVPVDKIVENGKLAGLVFRRTQIENGQAVAVPGTEFEVKAPYFISSIGSIPEIIPGIPAKGNVYDIVTDDCCRIAGYENVFALGNTVTGRGNIKESLKHGREMTRKLLDTFMHKPEETAVLEDVEHHKLQVQSAIDGLKARIRTIDEETFNKAMENVRELQARSGYDGNFPKWVSQHRPVRLEELLGGH